MHASRLKIYCGCIDQERKGNFWQVFKNLPAPINLEIPSHRYLSSTTIPIYFAIDALGCVISFFVIVAILSKLRDSYLMQRANAIKDPLTSLYNRLGLLEILNIEVENLRREGHPFLLLLVDCDNFKTVNDQWGHGAGDQVLKTDAHTIMDSIRRSDFASHHGGAEFIIFAGHIDENDAGPFIEKIRNNLNKAMHLQRWPATVSIGAAMFEKAPRTVDELIAFVDSLMYETKRSGKDGYCFAKWKDIPGQVYRGDMLRSSVEK